MADGKIWNQWNCSYLQASDVVGICDHTQTFPSLSAISHYHIAGQTLKRSEWWKHDWHGEWGRGKQWPENDVSKICIQNCIMTWIRVLSFCFSFREDSVNLTKDLNFFFQSLGSKFSKDCRSVPCLQQDWQRGQQRAAAEQRRSFHYPWDRCLTRRLLEWWREGHCWGYLTKWNCWMEWWTTGQGLRGIFTGVRVNPLGSQAACSPFPSSSDLWECPKLPWDDVGPKMSSTTERSLALCKIPRKQLL